MRSIMQETKECYLCRKKADAIGYLGWLPSTGLHRHHVMMGSHRKKAEEHGLWVWVCAEKHHVYGEEAPHQNREVAEMLMREAQAKFEETHSREEWMQEFGKNRLEE